jgi:SAM-dependent methyltransferase
MLQDQDNFDVDARFEAGLSQAGTLWRRLGIEPDFTGKHVMEVGSGLGFLTAAIALGVDIWQPRVEYGARRIAQRFPHLTNVRFDSTPTDRMEGAERFDVIVSQNTFEHISDIDGVLASFERLLKPGGVAHIGFSPLYHSPFGDHGELRAPVRLPWLHLIAGRRRVIASFNRVNRESVTTLQECGYNALKPADFRAAFARSGLKVERLRINQTEGGLKRLGMGACAALARLPGLAPYFTLGIYATLRKPEDLVLVDRAPAANGADERALSKAA